jgi:hypothetical protein
MYSIVIKSMITFVHYLSQEDAASATFEAGAGGSALLVLLLVRVLTFFTRFTARGPLFGELDPRGGDIGKVPEEGVGDVGVAAAGDEDADVGAAGVGDGPGDDVLGDGRGDSDGTGSGERVGCDDVLATGLCGADGEPLLCPLLCPLLDGDEGVRAGNDDAEPEMVT